MAMPRANAHTQRGGHVDLANALFVLIFRAAVFVLFAPIAWRYGMAGDAFACVLASLCAIGLGALLTPRD